MPIDQNRVHRLNELMGPSARRYRQLRSQLSAQESADSEAQDLTARPDVSEERVREHTGRGWQEWVDLIDAGPGRKATHAAIAEWVDQEHRVGGWWAQGITVGYERITGLRLPGQMPDGTFSVSRTKTLALEPDQVRGLIDDDEARTALLPGLQARLRSKPSAKSPRFSLTDSDSGEDLGVLQFRVEPTSAACRLVVTHDKLPGPAAGQAWKEHWGHWLEDLSGLH